eukprot:g82987.t1
MGGGFCTVCTTMIDNTWDSTKFRSERRGKTDAGTEMTFTPGLTDEAYSGEAYCVKCKEKKPFDGFVKISDKGRRMAQGICPTCGTKMNRLLGKAA